MRRRGIVRGQALLDFAEHFPGGGTDFEEPLGRALDLVTEQRGYRRGDIVFITDGEAQVSEDFLRRLTELKRRYRFVIHGIQVDVEASSGDTLERICDRLQRVTELRAEAVTRLFMHV